MNRTAMLAKHDYTWYNDILIRTQTRMALDYKAEQRQANPFAVQRQALMPIYAGQEYWVLGVFSQQIVNIGLYESEDAAHEALYTADVYDWLINAFEHVEPYAEENSEYRQPLIDFMRSVNGPVPTEYDFKEYHGYCGRLEEFLIDENQLHLWRKGFTIYGTMFQIACFTLR